MYPAVILFDILQYFDYERLVSLLLLIVGPSERQEEFVQRIGLYLLNSLACQVDGFNKKLVGDRGAITVSYFGSVLNASFHGSYILRKIFAKMLFFFRLCCSLLSSDLRTMSVMR